MESVEIASKSYSLKYVTIDEGKTISWHVNPKKHSMLVSLKRYVNFDRNVGLFRHAFSDSLKVEKPPIEERNRRSSPSYGNLSCKDRLKLAGLTEVSWHGKCDADRVTTGRYTTPRGEGGMYALCFGNNGVLH